MDASAWHHPHERIEHYTIKDRIPREYARLEAAWLVANDAVRHELAGEIKELEIVAARFGVTLTRSRLSLVAHLQEKLSDVLKGDLDEPGDLPAHLEAQEAIALQACFWEA